MEVTPEIMAFDRGVTPLLQIVLPDKAESIANFHPDPALSNRIEELAEKSTEGELTPEERAEYVGYVRANKFVSILKRQAERIAQAPKPNHE
jgi:transglutaminase-like putative cysteine protease